MGEKLMISSRNSFFIVKSESSHGRAEEGVFINLTRNNSVSKETIEALRKWVDHCGMNFQGLPDPTHLQKEYGVNMIAFKCADEFASIWMGNRWIQPMAATQKTCIPNVQICG